MAATAQTKPDILTSGDHSSGLNAVLAEVFAYEDRSRTTIRLIPTEGLQSPLQKCMGLSVQAERYLHAPPEDNEKAIRYPDIGPLQRIYDHCRTVARDALGARHCYVDFLAGLHAMSLAILALTEPGEVVASVDPAHGGHEATQPIVRRLGRRSVYLPFDVERHLIDPDAIPPGAIAPLVYLDQSNALFAHDLRGLRTHLPNSTMVVDISQVLALVVGHVFPNPLEQGADVVVATTHKSLCGPQKALLATNSEAAHESVGVVVGEFVSNNHPADVAALAVCLHEMRSYGRDFAAQLVANARTLAETFHDRGWPVYSGRRSPNLLTDTQHIWVDCQKRGWRAEDAVHELNEAGLVVNTLFLARGGSGHGAKGLRLGTTEVTRLGMKETEMRTIAGWIMDVLDGRTSAARVSTQVAFMREAFSEVRYCADLDDLPASLREPLRDLVAPYGKS